MPTSVQARDYANFNFKLWQFSLLFFFFSLGSLSVSAQEISHNESAPAEIVVVGDAVIYSKDASFNEQISKSKSIQQYSEIVKINDNELKIVAKNSDKPAKKLQPKIKEEVDLLAAKKIKESKKVNLPKKKIDFHISGGYTDSQFLSGVGSVRGSFVPPSNDYQYSKYFLISSVSSENISLEFLHYTNCFYKNDNSKLQVNVSSFSVRPPPSDSI